MFCLNYYPYCSYLDEADELKIYYHHPNQKIEEILQKYPNKMIIIDIANTIDDLDIKLLMALYEKYHNFKILIDVYDTDNINKIQESKIPFFFTNFVNHIDQLYGLMQYHPTDMYICEELGFFLDKVSTILHQNNIKVRVLPNICQSSFLRGLDSIKTFFIRPEDISAYSTFVDVFELISDQNTQPTIFKAYQQHKWFGKISEIIPSFHGELNSRYIMDNFGIIRSQCGKRCMYKPGSCTICDRFIEVADTLKKNNISIMHSYKNP